MKNNRLIAFEGKNIRRTWYKESWWFVITDIIAALTDTPNPLDYLKKMRLRDEELTKGWGQIVTPLSIETKGGIQKLNCANTEGIFRIIQSIPSPKAEPFKRWLAKVGYERIQEIENPELAAKRMRELYQKKGYSEEWIEKRARGIAVHDELTNEWKKHGVKEDKEYAILTAEISKATFGMTPKEYKEYKNLRNENLRDHMTDLELIFNMLGEASTSEIVKGRNPQGFEENKKAAKIGGKIAGDARQKLEIASNRKASNTKNTLKNNKKVNKILQTTN